MKTRIVSLLFTLTLAAVPALAGKDTSGTWKVSGSVYGTPVEATCTIKQEEKKLSGSCKSSDGVESVVTGEINDKSVKWELKREFNGSEITLVFSGTLDDETANMSGKINVQPYDVEGDFTAKKEEPESK
jgi:hypothetical protein